ncbi:MAG: hypothetical protein WCD53_24605 [Microcoleus sp.]
MERSIALFFMERSIALLELVKKCDRFLAIFDYMERAIGLVDGQGRSLVWDGETRSQLGVIIRIFNYQTFPSCCCIQLVISRYECDIG